MEIFDISQELRTGMVVWPGDPEFMSQAVLSVTAGNSTNLSSIRLGTHTGTHIDAPLHLSSAGTDVAATALKDCMGPVRVFDVPARRSVDADFLSSLEWHGIERVLFKTTRGRSGNSFDPAYVYIGKSAAEFLVQRQIRLVGIDSPSIDGFAEKELPSHKILLGHGIVVLENLVLEGVQPGDYMLACLPLKLAGLDGAPARAVLWR